MDNNFNINKDKELINGQYGSPDNLNARITLHKLYGTNKLGWQKWVFGNYDLHKNKYILELACGSGNIWKENADAIPDGFRLVLSDISEGMVEETKKNTAGIKNARLYYSVIDAQCIPVCDNIFDAVIGNHMLYHISDIETALSEIKRVLKPGGTFYAATVGKRDLKEISEMLTGFDKGIDFGRNRFSPAFSLENGEEILSKYFKEIKIKRYSDSLHITEPQPLIDYVLSYTGLGNISEIISGVRVSEFVGFVNSIFKEKGYFNAEKDAGIFIAQKEIMPY